MIQEINGDLLTFDGAEILCHQVNFDGVMGGGIALAIKNRLLDPEQYRSYTDFCEKLGKQALGEVQMLRLPDNRFVANLFCQNDWNSGPCLTNYAAMKKCLTTVAQAGTVLGYNVAVPGRMGCGIAGGDWNKVSRIIHDVFFQSPVTCFIVWKE